MPTANYINNGYEILPSINNRINLEEFRNIVEAEFKNLNYPSVMYPCLSNSEVSNYLISHIFNDHMSSFMNNLSELVGQEVLIFPTLEIMRNYFSCPALGRQGWHSDCNGELVYFECKSILKKPSYCFGKIGFYLQKNTDFGGQIDLLPRSHINVRESRQSISKFNIKLSNQLIKLGLGKFSLCNNWLSDIVVLNKKSINLMPMDLILFDSGIIHRGSPLKSTVLKEFMNLQSSSIINKYLLLFFIASLITFKCDSKHPRFGFSCLVAL